MPEELRSVVILRFFSGYTQAETAAALNIPQGTAATRQKRALALLKLELGEEDRHEPYGRVHRPVGGAGTGPWKNWIIR